MNTENNNISVPFQWSGTVCAITVVTLIILIGTGFYLEAKIWPEGMLWLKYLLITVISGTIDSYRIGIYAHTTEGRQ